MGVLFGAASQIRTGDLILTKDALYRLSYSSIFGFVRHSHSSIIIANRGEFVKGDFSLFWSFLRKVYFLPEHGKLQSEIKGGGGMRFWKRFLLFTLGGGAYVLLEHLWRGWSHISMFFLGGLCFLAIGHLKEADPGLSVPGQMVWGAGIITAGELGAGLLVNRNYAVWDYRAMPYNFLGQICLPFTLLWLPVSLAAVWLYDRAAGALSRD